MRDELNKLLLTDKQLVDLCKENNRMAQRMLYDRFYIPMTRLVFRYLNNEEDAFEVLNEGFLKVLTKIGQFEYRGEGSLYGWINRIMINESLMKVRVSKLETISLNENAQIPDQELDAMDANYLYDCIKRLPEGARTVFNLAVIEGYSHQEIATMLSINQSTSRSQLVFARRKMREMVTKIKSNE